MLLGTLAAILRISDTLCVRKSDTLCVRKSETVKSVRRRPVKIFRRTVKDPGDPKISTSKAASRTRILRRRLHRMTSTAQRLQILQIMRAIIGQPHDVVSLQRLTRAINDAARLTRPAIPVQHTLPQPRRLRRAQTPSITRSTIRQPMGRTPRRPITRHPTHKARDRRPILHGLATAA